MKFTITKKKSSLNNNEEKYMAKLLLDETLSFDELLVILNKRTRISKGDIISLFFNLNDVLIENLTNSKPVDLGPVGKIKPRIASTSKTNSKEVTPETITRKSCLYLPSKEIKAALNDLRIERKK